LVPHREKSEQLEPAFGFEPAPDKFIVDAFGKENATAWSYERIPPVGTEPPAVVQVTARSVAPRTKATESKVAFPVRVAALKEPVLASNLPILPYSP
jgi:hypothetical protein